MMRLTSIRRPVRRGIKDEKGQAAIELLLVFPVFIVVVLLAVDFGLWMYQTVSVASAVRDGARYAAVNCGGNLLHRERHRNLHGQSLQRQHRRRSCSRELGGESARRGRRQGQPGRR